MSKKKIVVLVSSAILIVAGLFLLRNAHALWTRYQHYASIRIPPYRDYVEFIKPFMEKFELLFPIYLTTGLVLFASGVTASLLTARKKLVNWMLHREKKGIEKRGLVVE